jgi:hypothetical protein
MNRYLCKDCLTRLGIDNFEIVTSFVICSNCHKYRECYKVDSTRKRKQDRITLVDEKGLVYEKYDVSIVESIQDNGKTLKLFIEEKKDD